MNPFLIDGSPSRHSEEMDAETTAWFETVILAVERLDGQVSGRPA